MPAVTDIHNNIDMEALPIFSNHGVTANANPQSVIPHNRYVGTLIDVVCSGGSSDPEQRVPGDFGGSANTLWTIYGNEAKSHDESRIQTLKDDMDGVLIFVRSYFVDSRGFRHIDSWQHRLVYFLRFSPHS